MAGAQQTLHTETELLLLNLCRVIRADGDDVIGVEQARFKERHVAIKFYAVNAKTRHWQVELLYCLCREIALKSQIVDGDDAVHCTRCEM